MKTSVYILITIAGLLLFAAFSSPSEIDVGCVAEGNLNKQYNNTYLDTTFNGEYYYVLCYMANNLYSLNNLVRKDVRGNQKSKPTVLVFRRCDNEDKYQLWFFQDLKIKATNIIATEKYLICLGQKQRVEIYNINDERELHYSDEILVVNH